MLINQTNEWLNRLFSPISKTTRKAGEVAGKYLAKLIYPSREQEFEQAFGEFGESLPRTAADILAYSRGGKIGKLAALGDVATQTYAETQNIPATIASVGGFAAFPYVAHAGEKAAMQVSRKLASGTAQRAVERAGSLAALGGANVGQSALQSLITTGSAEPAFTPENLAVSAVGAIPFEAPRLPMYIRGYKSTPEGIRPANWSELGQPTEIPSLAAAEKVVPEKDLNYDIGLSEEQYNKIGGGYETPVNFKQDKPIDINDKGELSLNPRLINSHSDKQQLINIAETYNDMLKKQSPETLEDFKATFKNSILKYDTKEEPPNFVKPDNVLLKLSGLKPAPTSEDNLVGHNPDFIDQIRQGKHVLTADGSLAGIDTNGGFLAISTKGNPEINLKSYPIAIISSSDIPSIEGGWAKVNFPEQLPLPDGKGFRPVKIVCNPSAAFSFQDALVEAYYRWYKYGYMSADEASAAIKSLLAARQNSLLNMLYDKQLDDYCYNKLDAGYTREDLLKEGITLSPLTGHFHKFFYPDLDFDFQKIPVLLAYHQYNKGALLPDVVKSKTLYELFPKLQQTKIFIDSNETELTAYYSSTDNVIGLSLHALKQSPEYISDTILHEMTHAIQSTVLPKGKSLKDYPYTEATNIETSLNLIRQVIEANVKNAGPLKDSVLLFLNNPENIPPVADRDLRNLLSFYKQLSNAEKIKAGHYTVPIEIEPAITERFPANMLDTLRSLATSKYSSTLFNFNDTQSSTRLVDTFRYLSSFYNLKPEDTAILFQALKVYEPLLALNPHVEDVKGTVIAKDVNAKLPALTPVIQLQPEIKAGPTVTAKLLSFRLARGLFESMQQVSDLKARLGIQLSQNELDFMKKRAELEAIPNKEKVINEALKEFPPEVREEALKGDFTATLLGLEMLSQKPPQNLQDIEFFKSPLSYIPVVSKTYVGTKISKELFENYKEFTRLTLEDKLEYTNSSVECAKRFGFFIDKTTKEIVWVGKPPEYKPKDTIPPSFGEDKNFKYYRGRDLFENVDKDFWVIIDKRVGVNTQRCFLDPRGRAIIIAESKLRPDLISDYAKLIYIVKNLPENKDFQTGNKLTPEVKLLARGLGLIKDFDPIKQIVRPKIETLISNIYYIKNDNQEYLDLTSSRELATLYPSGFSDWVKTALAYKQLYGARWLPAILKVLFPKDPTIVSSLLLADPELATSLAAQQKNVASAGKGEVDWITFRPNQPMDVFHEFAHHFINRHGAGALGEYSLAELGQIYSDLVKYTKSTPVKLPNKQEALTEIFAILLKEMKNDVKGIGLLSEMTKDIGQAEMFSTIVKSINLANILKTIASERKNPTYVNVATQFYKQLTLDPYKAYIARQLMNLDAVDYMTHIDTSNPLWRRPKELGKELSWIDRLKPISQLIKDLPELSDVAKLGRRVQSMISEMVIHLFGTGEDRFTQSDINRLAKDKKIRNVFNILAFWSQTPSLSYNEMIKARNNEIDLDKAIKNKKAELTKTLSLEQKMQIPEYRALLPEERQFVDSILYKASKSVERAAFARVRAYEKVAASTMASVLMTNKPDLKWSEAERLGQMAIEKGTVEGLDEHLTKLAEGLAADAKKSIARVRSVLLGDEQEYRFKSYLPEVRVGRYHINWTDLYGKRHYEAYHTLKDLEERLKYVRANAHEYNVRDNMIDAGSFAGMSKQALENFIDASQELYKSAIDKINKEHPDAENITKELQELFMPAKQMLELIKEPYMKERRLVAGRERIDYIDSLVHYINATANYTGKELARSQRRLLLADPELRANPSLREDARKYLAEIIDPKEHTLTGLKNIMFLMTLGYNPSQAFIEMTQTLLTHIPVLVNEGATLRDAYGSVANAFKDITGMLGHKGDFFERLKAAKTLTQEEKNFIARAASEKVIDVGWLAELYKLEEDIPFLNYRRMLQGEKDTLTVKDVMGNAMYHVLWGARKFYSYSVVANQIAALLSSYRLYKAQGIKDPYQKAVDTTYETMFGGGKAVRPLFFLTGPLGPTIGGLMYILQSYTFNAIAMQMRLAKNAISKTLPFTQRQQAMKAAALAFGTQMLAGGLLSLPFGSNLIALADQLFGTDLKRELREMIVNSLDDSQITKDERTLGQFVADFAMDGLPAAIGPVDISTRLQLGNLFGVDPYQGFSWNNLLGPTTDVLEGMFIKAPQAIMEGNIGEAASYFLPMGLRRFSKALANDLNVRTANGRLNFVPTTSELVLMGLGFRPKRLADYSNLAAMSQNLQAQETRKNRIISDKIADAIHKGDFETARQIIEQQEDQKGTAERAVQRYIYKYVPYSPVQEEPKLAGLYPPTPTMPKEVKTELHRKLMKRLGKFPKTSEETWDVPYQSRIYEPPRSPLQELLQSGQY